MKKLIFILLFILTISLAFTPVYALTNTIKQVIKIEGIYPAGASSFDVIINPPLTDTAKSTVFVSFSHTGENIHANTFHSYEIIDSDTLRIYGSTTTPAGNIAEEFEATVIEYTGSMSIQHSSRTWATSESAGEKSVTISSINTTASILVSKGHDHADSAETSVGSEELDRLRILSSTTWGQLIFANPNSSPQHNFVDVIDWKDPTIRVQRGITTLAGGSATTTITPATTYDRTRTILLITYAFGTGGTTTEEPDDFMLRATMNVGNQIVINRVGTEDDLQITWELIEFPANFVKVTYDQVTLADTVASTTNTLGTPVRDYGKSFVITSIGTPFGWGTGTATTTVSGAIDRAMVHLNLSNENLVNAERGDSTGTMVVDYMVVELLERQFSENVQGTNALQKIVKIEANFNAGNVFQDYTITPSLNRINKTMVFVTSNSTFKAGSIENGKNWEIINPSTFRMYGSGSAVNDPVHFMARFVEFTTASPINVQYDQMQFHELFTYSGTDTTRTAWISPVNTTGSFILQQGTVMTGQGGLSDPTFGVEEFATVSLDSSTAWTYQTETNQDEPETTVRTMVADFNQNSVFVQRGTGTLTTASTTITPPTAIDRDHSLVFVNYRTSGGAYGEFPNRASISATLNPSNQIEITRETTGISLPFTWQVISFPADFLTVQHGIHHQNAGQFNQTSALNPVGNLTNTFAIGTVNAYSSESIGRGSSSDVNDFDAVFAFFRLDNDSTLRVVRGDSTGSFDVGYQVTEFTAGLGGGDINQFIQMQPSCCFFFILPQWITDLILPIILLPLYLIGKLMI